MLTVSGTAGLVNPLVKRAMQASLIREWGIKQGMHVLGVPTPYNMLREAARYQTREISLLVRQVFNLKDGCPQRAQNTRLLGLVQGGSSGVIVHNDNWTILPGICAHGASPRRAVTAQHPCPRSITGKRNR